MVPDTTSSIENGCEYSVYLVYQYSVRAHTAAVKYVPYLTARSYVLIRNPPQVDHNNKYY